MADKLLKITYHSESKKMNAYLRMPSNVLIVLRREIDLYLFREHQLPKPALIRIFWIDAEKDEIEIVHQIDYEIFLNMCKSNLKDLHLHIAPVVADKIKTPKKTKEVSNNEALAPKDESNLIKHNHVICDACQMNPIIGFRYKCIQCSNFDLCQRCEAAHKHPDHMMVRMPTNNCPKMVDAWLTGPDATHSWRRHSRRARGQCPFAEGTTGRSTATGASKKDCYRERPHSRRIGGMLSQFMDMMVNLPESNVSATTTATAPTSNSAKEAETEEVTKSNNDATEEKKKNSKDTAVQVESMEQASAASAEPQNPIKLHEPTTSSTAKKEFQPAPTINTTPTTPVLNFENLSEIVPPEYLRAGFIDILSNFSKMFGKVIDPADDAAPEVSMRKDSTYSMDSANSTASTNTEACIENEKVDKPVEKMLEETEAQISNESSLKTEATLAESTEEPKKQEHRAESVDQEWQMIDSNTTADTTTSSNDASINATSSSAAAPAPATEVPNFSMLGEQLFKHVIEEKQREEAATQTPQVDSITTSTSSLNSNATIIADPQQVDGIRCIYHPNERINDAIHVMMSMGFSNEGAWLTQLLEMVDGNIAAALDNMQTSHTNRR